MTTSATAAGVDVEARAEVGQLRPAGVAVISPAWPVGDEIPGQGPGRVVRVPVLLVEVEGGQGPIGATEGDYAHGQQHQHLDDGGQDEQDPEPGEQARRCGPSAGRAEGSRRAKTTTIGSEE